MSLKIANTDPMLKSLENKDSKSKFGLLIVFIQILCLGLKSYAHREIRVSLNSCETQLNFPDHVVFESSVMKRLLAEKIIPVASTQATVLIVGPSGSGKDVLAHILHLNSLRKDKPFGVFNFGAFSDETAVSDLFGHKKGAFTGAFADKKGLFAHYDGGTVFIDEIGNASMTVQKLLLRLIENQEIQKMGDNQTHKVDVRIIAATNKNLPKLAEAGLFLPDLLARLKVVPIKIPPLSQRREDILPIANLYLAKFNQDHGKNVLGFTTEAKNFLKTHPFDGNVRELKAMVERGVIYTRDGGWIQPYHLELYKDEDLFDGTLSPLDSSTSHIQLPDRQTQGEAKKNFTGVGNSPAQADAESARLKTTDSGNLYNHPEIFGLPSNRIVHETSAPETDLMVRDEKKGFIAIDLFDGLYTRDPNSAPEFALNGTSKIPPNYTPNYTLDSKNRVITDVYTIKRAAYLQALLQSPLFAIGTDSEKLETNLAAAAKLLGLKEQAFRHIVRDGQESEFLKNFMAKIDELKKVSSKTQKRPVLNDFINLFPPDSSEVHLLRFNLPTLNVNLLLKSAVIYVLLHSSEEIIFNKQLISERNKWGLSGPHVAVLLGLSDHRSFVKLAVRLKIEVEEVLNQRVFGS